MTDNQVTKLEFFAFSRDSNNAAIPNVSGANEELGLIAQIATKVGLDADLKSKYERYDKEQAEILKPEVALDDNRSDIDESFERGKRGFDVQNFIPPEGLSDWLTWLAVVGGTPSVVVIFLRNVVGTLKDTKDLFSKNRMQLKMTIEGNEINIKSQEDLDNAIKLLQSISDRASSPNEGAT